MPASRPTTEATHSDRFPALLLAALVLLSMAGPVATDLYLPAFPRMAQEFDVGASAIQLTLTAFLLGMGGPANCCSGHCQTGTGGSGRC